MSEGWDHPPPWAVGSVLMREGTSTTNATLTLTSIFRQSGVAVGLQKRNEVEPAADTGILEHLPRLGTELHVLCSAAGW